MTKGLELKEHFEDGFLISQLQKVTSFFCVALIYLTFQKKKHLNINLNNWSINICHYFGDIRRVWAGLTSVEVPLKIKKKEKTIPAKIFHSE